MKHRLISYRELPPKLCINGLPCVRKRRSSQHGLRKPKEFTHEEYLYARYGTYPRAPELHDEGAWLVKTDPFFVEVERYEYARWTKKDEVLPQEIQINTKKLIRAFDRYYFASDLTEKEICFIFDYMAPTYESDINYWLNLEVNRILLESIAKFELPRKYEGEFLKILDYGVGTGICAHAEPNIKDTTWGNWGIVGLDISKEMIKQARRKNRAKDTESLLLDAYEIKGRVSLLPANSVHAAMACFAVQYFLDLHPYQEICRLLKPGAPFVCNVLKNEIYRVESRANDVGLVPQRSRRQQLDYEVRGQPVMLLAFVKGEKAKEIKK